MVPEHDGMAGAGKAYDTNRKIIEALWHEMT
jgi:hypothetical protein